MTPKELFDLQLEILANSVCNNCYILGDFNLDALMIDRSDYDRKLPLVQPSDFAVENNFFQLIDFCTWSRVINGTKKESILDHVYVNDISSIKNIKSETPTFGDHLLIIVELTFKIANEAKNCIVRNWREYSINSININLSTLLNSVTHPD